MRRLLLLSLFTTLTACGPSAPNLVPVTGTVTLDGSPIAEAVVVFLPVNATEEMRGAQGETDETGRFTLATFHDGGDIAGIAPGNYQVGITKLEAVSDMRRAPRHLVPKKYSLPHSSGLSATVGAGEENVFSFDL